MITKQLFERLFPSKGLNPQKYNLVRRRDELIDALNYFLPKYKINTYLRVVAFLACCGIETDYFKTSKEYASGADYEGRRDLGNVIEGDGQRYPGSSIIQTTGRFNFWRVVVRFIKKLTGKDFSKDLNLYDDFEQYLASPHYDALLAEADRLDVNFLAHPEKLTEVRYAVEAACIFWEENNLNKYADAKEFQKLNGVVNRGNPNKMPLHWAKRNELYSKCVRYTPKDFSFSEPIQIVAGVPDAPTVNQPIENSAEDLTNVVLTPINPTQPNTDQSANPDANAASPVEEKSKVKEFGDKYLRHCPQDTVKNVLAVLVGRIIAGITTVWALGLHGQILVIVAGIIVAGCLVYALYNYSGRIFGWIKDVADSFLGI